MSVWLRRAAAEQLELERALVREGEGSGGGL